VRELGDHSTGLARIQLDQPLPLRVGDRGLLRDPGDRRVWGVRVLDPLPPDLTRRGAARARAEQLGATPTRPDLEDELRRRGFATRGLLRQLGIPTAQLDAAPAHGHWMIGRSAADELSDRLEAEVRRHVRDSPLDPGLTRVVAVRRLGLPDPALLAPLVQPPVVLVDGRLRLTSESRLPGGLVASLERLRAVLEADPFAAPDAALLTELGLDAKRLAAAARAGRLLRLADQVVLLPDAGTKAVPVLATLPQPFTAGEARRALGTSRRVVLPLLAHLDRTGVTRRLPDDRRLLVRE
jgi:selenocysteine-specific elongation factor